MERAAAAHIVAGFDRCGVVVSAAPRSESFTCAECGVRVVCDAGASVDPRCMCDWLRDNLTPKEQAEVRAWLGMSPIGRERRGSP